MPSWTRRSIGRLKRSHIALQNIHVTEYKNYPIVNLILSNPIRVIRISRRHLLCKPNRSLSHLNSAHPILSYPTSGSQSTAAQPAFFRTILKSANTPLPDDDTCRPSCGHTLPHLDHRQRQRVESIHLPCMYATKWSVQTQLRELYVFAEATCTIPTPLDTFHFDINKISQIRI
jgi:hypothetical protein